MSMCVLGMAAEFKPYNIAVNALWPKTAIQTAAMDMLTGPESNKWCRKPDIMADAAYQVLSQDPKGYSGQFLIDEEVLAKNGVSDMTSYACDPANKDQLMLDFFLEDNSGKYKQVPFETPEVAPAAPAAPAAGKPTGQVAQLFTSIENSLSEELVKKTQALYHFKVTGNEAGDWFVDLRSGKGACGHGEAPGKPDAVLTMDSKNFFDMFAGKLKPATAYMMGKLKISGNLQKAMKLEKLMGSLKAKL